MAVTANKPSIARPIPDETLGEERSRVIDRSERDFDIDGGARRGANLFHSFQELGVDEGGSVYFLNPEGVTHIFSRVTGASRSDILGTLGVRGAANLFLMNPNGIVFGQNARLDVQGSFAATTANAIGFSEQGFFSATNPEVPSQLLTVNPSAFLFNQIPTSNIINRSARGLTSGVGSTVLLLGGDVVFDRSLLIAPAGFIDVGGLSGTGIVSLAGSEAQPRLAFSAGSPRADVILNGSGIAAPQGGGIRVQSRNLQLNNRAQLATSTGGAADGSGIQLDATGNLEIVNSRVFAGAGAAATGQSGNIHINAGNLTVQNATVETLTQGAGAAGSVHIQAANTATLNAGRILADARSGSTGSGGNVILQTPELIANNNSLISASTFGAGDAGDLTLWGDRLFLDNMSLITTQTNGLGNAGDIWVDTQQLRLQNGTQFVASSFGGGSSGNLLINADQIDLGGISSTGRFSGFLSVLDDKAIGQGGDISIQTDQLRIEDGLISTGTLGQGSAGNIEIHADRASINTGLIEANTGVLNYFGNQLKAAANGNSGNITIRANQLDLNDAFIRTQVGEQARGNAGNILLNVQQLRLFGNSQVSTATYGNGNAGNLAVQADQMILRGVTDNIPTGLFSLVETTGNGQGGSISIQANQIRLEDNATITASTWGNGNAGLITIQADRLFIDDSSITALIRRGAVGNGGNIQIQTNQLQIQNSGAINTSTRGRGNAGNTTIQAERIDLNNSHIISQVLEDVNTNGNSGNITINTQQLNLRNRAQVDTSTFANGSAGNIIVQADQLTLSNSLISSGVALQGQGQGGNLRLNVDQLQLIDRARILTSSLGIGNAGTITIQGQQLDMQNRSSINASTTGMGRGGNILLNIDRMNLNNRSVIGSVEETTVNQRGGNITIRAAELTLSSESAITAAVLGTGAGGEVVIAADRMAFDNSLISTVVVEGASGNAGNITLNGRTLSLQNNAQINLSLFGRGNAGNLLVRVDNIDISGRNADGDSSFSSNVEENGNGRAGNIRVVADRLRLSGTANISASVEGMGQAGDISIQANQVILDLGFIRSQARRQATEGNAGNVAIETDQLNLLNGGQISTGSFTRGNAGNITINADRINITGANPNNGQPSGIFSVLETQGRGRSGNIEIETDWLQIRDGIITASTRGVGNAGDLFIVADQLQMSGGLISSTVQQNALGNGGRLTVSGRRLNLSNGGQIATITEGNGNAGRLFINVERIDLNGARRTQFASSAGEIAYSGFASSVERGGAGRGGDLRVETNQLRVRNGARITAATEGIGSAGDVVIVAQDGILLDGTNRLGPSSEISSSNATGSQGSSGTITLQAGTLRIAEGAVINAQTANANRGGNVIVDANLLEAINGGQIVTTTLREGQAGNITLNIRDRIMLSGREANLRQRQTEAGVEILPNAGRGESGLFASSRSDSTGNGGRITLNTTDLDLRDRARISAQSQGTGAAGEVMIQARGNVTLHDRAQISTASRSENALAGDLIINAGGTFAATDGDVTTSAANASGGDIRLTARDIRLYGDSDIRTNSARNGGNITLNAETIVAFDDSDIFASAAAGSGGDIRINTAAFFGNAYQPDAFPSAEVSNLDRNDRVDFNATGSIRSGTISTPDTSFIQNSLTDLSEVIVDADRLIANSCIARTDSGGTFLITGAGGLPPSPGVAPLSPFPTGEVRTEISRDESSLWQSGDAIEEPQGVYQLPNGELVMSRECALDGAG
ncbi:MAG TPA: filamentous hemagglutinin N-terminal domain-containing protein [Trichocoleus sp.]